MNHEPGGVPQAGLTSPGSGAACIPLLSTQGTAETAFTAAFPLQSPSHSGRVPTVASWLLCHICSEPEGVSRPSQFECKAPCLLLCQPGILHFNMASSRLPCSWPGLPREGASAVLSHSTSQVRRLQADSQLPAVADRAARGLHEKPAGGRHQQGAHSRSSQRGSPG